MLNKFYSSRLLTKVGFQAVFLSFCAFTSSSMELASKEASVAQTAIDFTDVAKKAIPAVVSIKVKAKQKNNSFNPWGGNSDEDSDDTFNDDFFKRFFFGLPFKQNREEIVLGQASGFIVSQDGIILTNSHVVKDVSEIVVALNDGREFSGKVLGQDPNTDIAVVKIDTKNLPFLALANSDELQIGQWAIAIGNPLGLQASLTVGVVSATGRNNLDLARVEDFIQTDAAINRGNSGGPLLNLEGNVIGMNTAIFTNASSGGGYMGIGFAIPSNMLKHIMDELIQTGTVTRGFLGVVLQQMDSNLAKAFNLDKTEGALVAEINLGSPAEKAGLKQGDIILKYNKQLISNIAALRNAIALMKPGSSINLTVLREGKTLEIPINIGTFPVDGEKAPVAEMKGNKYGFTVQELTPEIAKNYNYKEEKGVVISKVDPSSTAAWAGLKPGTLILAVNQKKVNSVNDFNNALEAVEKDKPLLLLVKQGDAVRFISLQIN